MIEHLAAGVECGVRRFQIVDAAPVPDADRDDEQQPAHLDEVHRMFVHIDWRMPQKLTNVRNARNERPTRYHGQPCMAASG